MSSFTLNIGKERNPFNFQIQFYHTIGYGGWHFGIWYCHDGFTSFDFIKVGIRIGRGL